MLALGFREEDAVMNKVERCPRPRGRELGGKLVRLAILNVRDSRIRTKCMGRTNPALGAFLHIAR